ncbi:alanine/glycine:cation symporter family protein [Congregibacter litoralis]|uniref:Amino acid carrier protein n=1 Tax=Congregibacter litoralis KT71 TaxID=314285 RepID=A4A5L1_9GAMM|nr:alanine/glycine:cation symporter family protein [Congregibacter litoralis]EAQ99082.1 amino acid carrier protein [Congregibacter litoralis KT71]
MLAMLSDLLWSKVLVVMLVGIGLYFTVASRFVQFRYFGRMFAVLGSALHHEKGHVSSFQALVVSVAGRVGGGNIAGVAVAITLGGPGAVFWMWVIGLMGMATSFFECSLAQLYKRYEPDGSFRGGPAYYLTRGINQRGLAIIYSLLLLITFGFGFNAVQSYVVATSLDVSFGVPTWASGLALVVFLGFVIFGGIQRIAAVSEIVVPVMAVSYFACALLVIGINIQEVPAAFATIVSSAFGLDSALGGGIGVAIMQGVKRGLFSNEAGLGSAPNVAAVAFVPHPANQGIVQAFSVFIDTIVMCSCTALIILLSDVYQPGDAGVSGVALTQSALAEHLGAWGGSFVSIALVMFAFSSIMYNYYLGENALNYFSESNRKLFAVFRITVLGLVFWGAAQDLGTVFGFADLTMGLLGVVNLIGLLWMSKLALRLLRDYDDQLAAGKAPRLNPDDFSDLDIDRRAWPSQKDL